MVRLFNHWVASNALAGVFFDVILIMGSVMAAVAFVHHDELGSIRSVLPGAILFTGVMIFLNVVVGLYQRSPSRTVGQTSARIFISLVFAVPVAWAVFTFLPQTDRANDMLWVAVPVACVAGVALRAVAAHNGMLPMFTRRTLVLGTGLEAIAVERSIGNMGPGVRFLGFFPARKNETAHHVPASRVLAGNMDLLDAARRYKVDEIIVAVRERRGGVLPLRELLDCKLMGVRVLDLSSFYERVMGQLRLDSLHASWLIFGDGFRQGLIRVFIKRLFDIAASSVLLLLAAPVMLLTALVIALESGFPILYRQERVGQAGRLFNVIKFRSMRRDAEIDGKPRWAVSNDDRITRTGRFIRKLRIDELPQLINVLRGDMSLVGPRPERPYFVDQLAREIPYYAVRHSVKPGVTGWAQVRYHYSASFEDSVQKLQYDLYYVKNHSLYLDIVILCHTISVVMTGAGAR